MATPKIQNAYRNPSSDTEDIADLLLVTTSGLATDGDAGASYIVFHNGTNDVLVSSSNALPVSVSGVATAANQATANGLLTTIDADTGTIATHAATLAGAVSGTEMQVDIVSGTVTVTGVSTLAEQQSQTTLLGTIDADTGNIATSTTDLPNVIGTDGSAGPSKAVSMAGTESGGTLQELRVDADGHLQIDVLSTTGTTTVSGTVDLGATDNAVLDAIAASVASTDGKITACNTGAVVVSSSALPSGAATAAKQPALGTAGTASSDVITIQGVASMTPIQIADNGGAITVDNGGTFAVQAAQSGTWNITNVSGTVSLPTGASTLTEQQTQTGHLSNIQDFTETINTHTDNAAISLGLLDDAVVAVDAVGTSAKVLMQGAIRDDALSTLTPVEGDAVNLRTDANGALWTAISGTVTVGSHAVTNAGTFAVQVSSALPAGTNAIGKLAANDGVDIGDVTINNASLAVTGTFWQATQPISATFAGTNGGSQPTNAVQLGYYIDGDAFSLVADTNPYPVRDTGLNDSNYVRVIGGYDGSQVRKVAVNASGYVYTNALMQVGGTVASGNNGTVDNSTQRVTIASDSTGTLAGVTTVTTLTGGGVAHDSADSGNPVKVGAKAASSLASATLVSAADRTNLVSDLDGALLVRNGAPLGDNKSTSQSVTDTTSTAATNFGAVASTKNVITEITVYNSSATPTFVKIQDGSGGTTFWTVPAPAGGGSVIQFHRGLKQPTANTALYFAANDSATTVYVSINGYQSKV